MRVKRGLNKNRRHKKVLESAKGYRLTYSKLYRRAREALLHAGQYSFAHRKKRGNDFRRAWIKSINAVCRLEGTTYSKFIKYLSTNNIKLDRKILGYLAVNHQAALTGLVKQSIS